MITGSLDITYGKNDLVMSADELRSTYFFGIPLKTVDGQYMSDDDIEFYIRQAQDLTESLLSIIINKTVVEETQDYIEEFYYNRFCWLNTSKPIEKVVRLTGSYTTVESLEFPESWFAVESVSKVEERPRSFQLKPTAGTILQFLNINSVLALWRRRNIPQFFKIKYTTGFDVCPANLVKYIGKLASVELLNIFGDILFGAGLASASISIDGLSQSLGTTNSATSAAFGARLNQYGKELPKEKESLKAIYGDNFIICR